jgi:hypothetical protein
LGEEGKSRRKAAVSLHEAFIMFKDTEEDLSVYKDIFLDVLADDQVKVMKITNGYLSTILFNYINNYNTSPQTPLSGEDFKDNESPFDQ